jgi:hypothetical protein
MNTKKLSKLIGLTAILAVVTIGAGVASADVSTNSNSNRQNHMASLIQAIANKFNLNATELEAVVDETMQANREQMQAEREEEFANRLAKAVTDGKITQAQSDLITAKKAEMRSEMETERGTFSSLSKDEIKTKMEARRAEIESWAETNNIPLEYLMGMNKGGEGKGRGHGGNWGQTGNNN